MTEDSYYTIPKKVSQILSTLSPEYLERLSPRTGAVEGMDAIAAAFAEVCDQETAEAIAFNVGDWQDDAAFLTALHICPEKFTSREIREGVEGFLLNADIIAQASRLVDELEYEED